MIFDENPKVVSFPFISYPGCTDDKKYNFGADDWKPVNWAAVVTLSSIGFLIIVGSFLDVYLRSQKAENEFGKDKERPKLKESYSLENKHQEDNGWPKLKEGYSLETKHQQEEI